MEAVEQKLPKMEPGHTSEQKLPRQEHVGVHDDIAHSEYPKWIEHPVRGATIALDAEHESMLKAEWPLVEALAVADEAVPAALPEEEDEPKPEEPAEENPAKEEPKDAVDTQGSIPEDPPSGQSAETEKMVGDC